MMNAKKYLSQYRYFRNTIGYSVKNARTSAACNTAINQYQLYTHMNKYAHYWKHR